MPAAPDRDKALDLALAQIEKNFGKGAIMRLGDDTRPPIQVIPSGSIALDVAMGVGGYPRGRVIEVYGPESSGKCLVADTYVWTDKGLETVEELFARAGQKASCTNRITDVTELDLRAVNERGELEPIAALTHNNRKPVLKVQVESGRTVSVTHNHPLRVVSERGFIVWRKAGELKVGDTLVSAAFGAVEAAGGDGLSEDEAVFLGYLVAEGTLGQRNATVFTNWDLEVSGEYTKLATDLFGVTVKSYADHDFAIHSKAFRTLLAERYGLEYTNAPGKTVPHCVRTAGHKVQRAFLSALYEGDGWIDDRSCVGFGSASEELARQVQLMLLGLGIPASLYTKRDKTYDRDYWTVAINAATAHRFFTEIGFRSERRQKQAEKNFRQSARSPQLENVPGLRGLLLDLRDDCGGDRDFDRIARDLFREDTSLDCSRHRLQQIVAWASVKEHLPASSRAIVEYLRELAMHSYTFERIAAIEDGGLQPTFDLMLPKTHSFLANGLLSHNTTLALHAIASAQAAGGIAAFIDAEHALDPTYAKALGVDTDALLVSQPDTGEQALEIMDMLIRSGSLDVVVVDSVAALVPRAEIEGEMGDSHVGLQARLMSQALRKIAGALSQSGTTAIFINQLREKIGVMFGCFSYGTRVTLADGTQEKIGKIVNQKLPVEVLAYDEELGRIVPRKVVGWYDNGVTDKFLQITVAKPSGNGRAQMGVTENHQILTPGGWREAGELLPGDRVLISEEHRLSDQQLQLLLGTLMGDGNLSPGHDPDSPVTRFRMGHGAKQRDYLAWKSEMFGNIEQCRIDRASDGAAFVDVTSLPELCELRRVVYQGDGKKHLTWDYLKALTPLSLAAWYMDDGAFSVRSKGVQERTAGGSGRIEICVEAMSPGTRDRLVECLRDTWGVHTRIRLSGATRKAVMVFTRESTDRFQEIVASYVHPSMDYKLLPRLRGQFAVEPVFVEPRLLPAPSIVTDVRIKPPTRSMHRFDIQVEGSHTYLADGVIVHNSPETTTGGKALKFYATMRLDVRRIETLKDGTEAVGNKVRVKVVKNKVASPFRQAELEITYGSGISRVGGLVDMGVEHGFVRKSGAWYTYEGDQLGQGRENAKQFLLDNPDLADEIEKKIKEKLGVGPVLDAPVDLTADAVAPEPVDF